MTRTLSIRFFFFALLTLVLSLKSATLFAREGMSVSVLGLGNIMLVDTKPELSPGAGGGISFDYRFNSKFSLETSVLITTHGGKGDSEGDDGTLLMGLPTVDLKYYLLAGEHKFDPYVGIGVGLYFTTEGTQNDHSGGVGLGSQFLVGLDYYISDSFSVGLGGAFRSIALITGTDDNTGQNATALLPYTLFGKVGFHF